MSKHETTLLLRKLTVLINTVSQTNKTLERIADKVAPLDDNQGSRDWDEAITREGNRVVE